MEQLKKKKEKKEKKEWIAVFRKTGEVSGKAWKYLVSLLEEVSESFWTQVEEETKNTEKTLRHFVILTGTFLGLLFLGVIVSLARFPLGIYPAGFSLLASLGGGRFRFAKQGERNEDVLEKAFLLTVFSGVLLSCAFLEKNGFFYLLAYLILFLTRAGITGGKLDDSVLTRVTFSAAISTALGILLAFFEGFSVSFVFAAVSMGILTPILTYLLCGFYIFTVSQSSVGGSFLGRRVYLEATGFTLVYLFLYALREVLILNFSLAFVLSVLFTLALARKKGALYGAAAGMITGMACASSAVSPALAVGGFFAGLFFEYSAPVAMMISFVSACGYSMYADGLSAFGRVTADYLCALVLFFPLLRFFPKEKVRESVGAKTDLMHKETMRRTRQKLRHMSDAFSSLSEVFYTVSDTMKKPSLPETSRLVSECCSRICSRCDRSAVCWGEQQGITRDATARLSALLLADGIVLPEKVSAWFTERCKNIQLLCQEVNRRFDELSGNFYKNNKTRLLAGEYSSVSRLLKSTAGELDQELEYNPALETRAKKVLSELKIPYRRVAVFGSREMRIDIYGIALEKVNLTSDEILRSFESEFGASFAAPGFLMLEESVVMRLSRKRSLALECAKSGGTKKGESVSGDSASFFETERDFFYSLICDGMGSGREAAFTSRLASIFIEKLMHCATPKNVTLEMLNAFLMSKTDETFTTVDLLEIDLLSGKANFIKAGAAPSFVLRGDRLHRIESRTPPAGILTRMCAEQTAFELKAGDYIIQLSDGAEEAGEGSGWLVKLLTDAAFENAAALCDLVFRAARDKGAFRDDLSITVVRVMNNK